jgi:hypothetical protein
MGIVRAWTGNGVDGLDGLVGGGSPRGVTAALAAGLALTMLAAEVVRAGGEVDGP